MKKQPINLSHPPQKSPPAHDFMLKVQHASISYSGGNHSNAHDENKNKTTQKTPKTTTPKRNRKGKKTRNEPKSWKIIKTLSPSLGEDLLCSIWLGFETLSFKSVNHTIYKTVKTFPSWRFFFPIKRISTPFIERTLQTLNCWQRILSSAI